VFSKYPGYVFHDFRGFEAGGEEELRIVQKFIRQKSREIRLKDRLHAIWLETQVFTIVTALLIVIFKRYCVPMDNQRPELDLRYFRNINIFPDESGT
jgi:hypothetical protein